MGDKSTHTLRASAPGKLDGRLSYRRCARSQRQENDPFVLCHCSRYDEHDQAAWARSRNGPQKLVTVAAATHNKQKGGQRVCHCGRKIERQQQRRRQICIGNPFIFNIIGNRLDHSIEGSEGEELQSEPAKRQTATTFCRRTKRHGASPVDLRVRACPRRERQRAVL